MSDEEFLCILVKKIMCLQEFPSSVAGVELLVRHEATLNRVVWMLLMSPVGRD